MEKQETQFGELHETQKRCHSESMLEARLDCTPIPDDLLKLTLRSCFQVRWLIDGRTKQSFSVADVRLTTQSEEGVGMSHT